MSNKKPPTISTWYGARKRRKKSVSFPGSILDKLPVELILKILGNLSRKQLKSSRLISRQMNTLATDFTLWKPLVVKNFPKKYPPEGVSYFHFLHLMERGLYRSLNDVVSPGHGEPLLSETDIESTWNYLLYRDLNYLEQVYDKGQIALWCVKHQCFKAFNFLFDDRQVKIACTRHSLFLYYVAIYGDTETLNKLLSLEQQNGSFSYAEGVVAELIKKGHLARIQYLYHHPNFQNSALESGLNLIKAIQQKKPQVAAFLLSIDKIQCYAKEYPIRVIESCLKHNHRGTLRLLLDNYSFNAKLQNLFPINAWVGNLQYLWGEDALLKLQNIGRDIELNEAECELYERLEPTHQNPCLKIFIKYDLQRLGCMDIKLSIATIEKMPDTLINQLFSIEPLRNTNKELSSRLNLTPPPEPHEEPTARPPTRRFLFW